MTAVHLHEATWRNPANGHPLFYRLWEPEQPKTLMVLVHGFGEHGGRYEAFGQALADRGLVIACPDLWGHGRSAGQRGDMERLSQYVDDLESLTVQAFLPRTKQKSAMVFGHSFGGLVAIHWALRHPQFLRSLVLQAPLLEVAFPVPRWKESLAAVLNRVWGRLALPIGLNPAWLSHDPAVVQRYQQDPLVHHWITLRGFVSLQEAMRQALEAAPQVASPALVLYGAEDRVVSVKACQAFFERLPGEKRLIGFPGCYHELHHESAFTNVVEAVVRWAETHA